MLVDKIRDGSHLFLIQCSLLGTSNCLFRAVETLFDGSVNGRLFAPAVPGAAVIARLVRPVLIQKPLLELLEWMAHMALER